MNKEETSEYGKGFIYNLVLFAKHCEGFKEYMKRNDKSAERNPELFTKGADDMWFNGAGDHFFELEIPEVFKGTDIEKLAKELQDEAIERRLGSTTYEEFVAFFKKLEKLTRMIDKYLEVESIEADYN